MKRRSIFAKCLACLCFCAMLFSTVAPPVTVLALTTNEAKIASDSVMQTLKNSDGTVYECLTTLEGILTDSVHPWTCDENGVLFSGNKNVASSVSVMKITVKGSGALTFKCRVSSEGAIASNTQDSLIFWKNTSEDEYEPIKSFAYSYVDRYMMTRYFGETEWTECSVPVDAGKNDITTVFFIYKKNGSKNVGEDTAYIKDLKFLSGSVSFSLRSCDEECGTVEGKTECFAGESVILKAVPKADCCFYGWNVNGKIVSREAEYTVVATEGLKVVGIFGKADGSVAQNQTTGYVYSSVTEALRKAESGDAIMLAADASVIEDTIVPENVILYIPYNNSYNANGTEDGTPADSKSFAESNRSFCSLTVAQNVSLTVNGVLRIGGVIGYPGQNYQGHSSGAYGQVFNNGSVIITEKGCLDCYGFIRGSGTVEAESGARIYEPFVVYDYSGGTNTLTLVNAGMSPFTQYTMQNIQCPLRICSGAVLYGRCNLYASSQYNKTDAVVVGDKSEGLLQLKDGAVLERTVDTQAHLKGAAEDIACVHYKINGGAAFSFLSMYVLGTQVSTEGVLFPIPYSYSYELANGEYGIATDTILMPGARITVARDAVLNVNKRFFVLDGLKQNSLSGKSYPDTRQLCDSGFSPSGELIVNGKLVCMADVPFGGIVQTEVTGAQIVTRASIPESTADCYRNTVTLGAKTSYGDNTTVLPLEARIKTGEDTVRLTSGNIYTADSSKHWILDAFSVDSYTDGTDNIVHTDETFAIHTEKSGTFVEGEFVSLRGDLNADNAVNKEDMKCLSRYFAGIGQLTEAETAKADLNNDGYLDAVDLALLLQLVSD